MAVLSADRRAPARAGWAARALALVVTSAALGAAFVLSPHDATNGPVICPFRRLTGLPCPGCGLTRGWVFLAHGHLDEAIRANPFTLVTMPAAVLLAGLAVVALLRRRPLPDLSRLTRAWTVRALLGCWLAFAVIRAIAVATGHASA